MKRVTNISQVQTAVAVNQDQDPRSLDSYTYI